MWTNIAKFVSRWCLTGLVFSLSLTVPANASDIMSLSNISVAAASSEQGTVVISCRPYHQEGKEFFQRVAVDVNWDKEIVGIPILYDDGTHGDRKADDGIYSAMVSVPEGATRVSLKFYLLDINGDEAEIGPVEKELP